ncbi:hypothetical protein OU997_03205 [Pseudomonas sp. SL4(2022)]|uniref:hypothetical protein n=1 Tax=Pseudomonas sp. SL4(2022) TaxID=2994661 RepID=UPI002270E895|nr:hypothetical protein [Pseudomonas sp. SL4(2022)]WAC45216.1 hypothetical protein OU997_03205 [Pseudomonas sp. SL4(2022)]
MARIPTVPFPVFFKKNLKRVLEHWTPITVTLSFFGVGVGILSLYVYTRAIGRIDLFMPATDAKSALAIWLLLVLLTMAAYLITLTVTTWLYGISVSQFDKIRRKHNQVACWLLIPLLIGFGTFILMAFFSSELFKTPIAVSIIAVTTVLGLLMLLGFRRFRILIALNTCRAITWQQALFLLWLAVTLVFTVISAAISTSLILTSYVGDDTQEAIRFVAKFSMGTLVLSLIPTFVFYTAKGDIYRRVAYGCSALVILFLIFLLLAPGAMTSITFAAAGNLEIRQNTTANFILDDQIELDDLDNLQWRTRLHPSNKVAIQGFQLFSFGDVLLLCPSDLLELKPHELPHYTRLCLMTRNSRVNRKPLRPHYLNKTEPSPTWQEHAERLINWKKLNPMLKLPQAKG